MSYVFESWEERVGVVPLEIAATATKQIQAVLFMSLCIVSRCIQKIDDLIVLDESKNDPYKQYNVTIISDK